MTLRTEAPTVPEAEVQPLHAALLHSGWVCVGAEGWIPPALQLAKPLAFERAVAALRADASKPPRSPRPLPLPA